MSFNLVYNNYITTKPYCFSPPAWVLVVMLTNCPIPPLVAALIENEYDISPVSEVNRYDNIWEGNTVTVCCWPLTPQYI